MREGRLKTECLYLSTRLANACWSPASVRRTSVTSSCISTVWTAPVLSAARGVADMLERALPAASAAPPVPTPVPPSRGPMRWYTVLTVGELRVGGSAPGALASRESEARSRTIYGDDGRGLQVAPLQASSAS